MNSFKSKFLSCTNWAPPANRKHHRHILYADIFNFSIQNSITKSVSENIILHIQFSLFYQINWGPTCRGRAFSLAFVLQHSSDVSSFSTLKCTNWVEGKYFGVGSFMILMQRQKYNQPLWVIPWKCLSKKFSWIKSTLDLWRVFTNIRIYFFCESLFMKLVFPQ